MRALIQRVTSASVTINGNTTSSIGMGLLVFVGIEEADTVEDIEWLSGKICALRIFSDEYGVMNLSVKEALGQVLVVSQFTLHALTKKGNRPSYIKAAKADVAVPLYNAFVEHVQKEAGMQVATGEFGADMQVSLVNNGPVTIFIDSKNKE